MADAKIEQDDMAAEWAAALEQQASASASEVVPAAEQVAPASFANFAPTPAAGAGRAAGTLAQAARARANIKADTRIAILRSHQMRFKSHCVDKKRSRDQ